MESIIKNLGDPSWWFTGLFFVLIALAIPKGLQKIQSAARGLDRYIKFKNRKKVKSLRWDLLEIHLLINRASANYVVFIVLCFTFLTLLTLTPLSKSFALAAFASIPIYIFEILWLIPQTLVKQAIKYRNKVPHLRRMLPSPNNSFKPMPLRDST